ncbi:ABC transporter permease [Variovorax sp. Sphag1AA]|uniref:ABC transporter permease n=1 Tax=Variovorax sp. Sphag1AA TaxID=2587027 RepID=UPI001619B65E|nr:ABC transporter permease [Variovorax sp. Sphag1AA]MBB3180270.1 ABC-2 type transport system permease protein [Variovorax sp. Sphag1AA]
MTDPAPSEQATQSRFWRRLIALTRKETRQLIRDPSSIAIGILLPIILILIFGYGLSLDVKNAPMAVVLEDTSPTAAQAVAGLQLTPYISPVMLTSMRDAEALMHQRKVDGIVRVPADFSRRLAAGDASIQVIVHGADANKANIVLRYATGALAQNSQRIVDRAGGGPQGTGIGAITIEQRLWFNSANTSTWYLVPGLIVLIMTLVGAFLTALVMAREWERGTLESLFVTPVRPVEILLAKVIPYFGIGMIGLLLCLLAARFLFEVPMYGSLAVMVVAAMLYLLVAVGIGLLISSVTRNQFLASQVALISSFLPSLMLSGFLFDLRNVPTVIRIVGHVLPATYFMELIRTLFLAGNVWSLIVRNCLILLVYAVVLLSIARFVTRKKLD